MKNRENRENGYLMLLMQNALFQGFTEEKIESTLKALKAQRKRFKRGVFVYHEGQRNVKAAIVLAGSLHIIKEDFWGNRSILAEVEKGDMFAETYSCIGTEPLGVSVMANEDCECLFMDFQQLADAQILANIIRILASKNLFLTKKVEFVSQRTTRQKLLAYLSEEGRRKKSAEFEIPFNRQQLADFLAVERSAMSAELSKLQKEGILEYRKNRFLLKEL